MKRLTYQKAVNARRLYDELAQLPKLAPVVDPALLDPETGRPGGRRAAFSLSANATTVEIIVDDGVDERAIAAVLDAHDGTPNPDPAPTPSRDGRLLASVEQAKQLVSTSRAFTPEQAATLVAVVDGLGAAIRGQPGPGRSAT